MKNVQKHLKCVQLLVTTLQLIVVHNYVNIAYLLYIINYEQNFLALCASDYYNGCLFHRNIKGFIVQTGDPTHTGKGGSSIWGRKFEDEFKENLKVIRL